jgi:uncharacterized protein YndB with AHSA1/START domain
MSVPVHDPQALNAPRSAAVTLEIDAPVEAVWQALTDPVELARWFPTDAAVDPRPGGTFAISWDGQWKWEMTITDFEPLHRLRMVDRAARPFDANGQPVTGSATATLALEIVLDGRGGCTVLRLVHSGFGSGAEWEDELDGVTLGWNVELRGLRHYLARHRGRTRTIAWAHAASPRPVAEIWRQLTSPAGLIADGWTDSLNGGDAVSLRLTTGDAIEGRVIYSVDGRQLLIDAENLGHSLVRLSLDRAAGQSMAQVWLSSWTLPAHEVQAVGGRLRHALSRALSPL